LSVSDNQHGRPRLSSMGGHLTIGITKARQ
jgi:hypothetical protein